jgi:tetratricopeptide (TPR) repeat protein
MSWWNRLTNKRRGVFGSPENAPQTTGGCDHEAIHLRQGTAEFEWFVARGELEMTHDLKHGASHLANLLSYDPGNPEWVELLERYLKAAEPEPEAMIPRGDKLYYSTEALRAYIWHKKGRLEDAVRLLVDVTHAKPDARYLEAWCLGWLEPAGAIEFLEEQLGLRLFAEVLNRFPEAKRSPAPRLRELQRWARLSERFAGAHPGAGVNTMVRAGLLRKAGLFDVAEAVVRPVLERSPDWHTATALGLILREKGDCAGAEQAFRRALQIDPDDVSARLEAGDMYYDRQQWKNALAWYENALAKESDQPWAEPSALFCRWRLTDDERHIRSVIKLAKNGNNRARQLYHHAFSNGLPEPHDATANLLRNFRQAILEDPKKAPTGQAKMTLTSLEAPSNYLAIRLEMEALRHDLQVKIASTHIPRPDPRVPFADVKYVLWKYDGIEASPGLLPPRQDVVRRIAALAAAHYDEQLNWAAASRVAEELGSERVGEILAVMVHPPAVPAGWTALAWLPRVQLAAAQIAAQVDGGWEGSARREALLSVLFGPQDWATEAAIRALARLGCEDEAYAPDIHDAFQQLADHRPDAGHWNWEHTLYSCWLELPHLYPKEREALEQKLREIEASAQQQDE